MNLLRTVVIKQLMTKKEKEKQMAAFQRELTELQRQKKQLSFQMRQTLRKDHRNKTTTIKEKYEKEIKKIENKLQAVLFKIEQLQLLPLGAELEVGSATQIVEVKEGDRYPHDREAEIVIKDGIIYAIREGRNRYD